MNLLNRKHKKNGLVLSLFFMTSCTATFNQIPVMKTIDATMISSTKVTPTLNQTGSEEITIRFSGDEITTQRQIQIFTDIACSEMISQEQITSNDTFDLIFSLMNYGDYTFYYKIIGDLEESQCTLTAINYVYDKHIPTLYSVAADSSQGNQNSTECILSPDGSLGLFSSSSSNLHPDALSVNFHVFLKDLSTNALELISVDSNEIPGDNWSYTPSISSDNRYVVFWSTSSNLFFGDGNGSWDVFLRDRVLGTTTGISWIAGSSGSGSSVIPEISSNGEVIVFKSQAIDLDPNVVEPAGDKAYWYDRIAGEIHYINIMQESWSNGRAIRVDATGRYITFVSSQNLTGTDLNGFEDVYFYDRITDTYEIVSVDSNEVQGNGHSNLSALSSGGRYVAFESAATNLISGDTNGVNDIFLRDRTLGTTIRVSVSSSGTEGNGASKFPDMSEDGSRISYQSAATNLVTDDTNNVTDVFVYNLSDGKTERISKNQTWEQGNALSEYVRSKISADGNQIGFTTFSSNFANDTNGNADCYSFEID